MSLTWVCKYCNLKKECKERLENGEYIDTQECESKYYAEQEKQWERDNEK